ESGKIDAPRCQEIDVLLREIVAHDTDELHIGEVLRGERNVSRRAAEHAIDFAVRSFNAVVCDGTNYDEGHGTIDCSRGGSEQHVEIGGEAARAASEKDAVRGIGDVRVERFGIEMVG